MGEEKGRGEEGRKGSSRGEKRKEGRGKEVRKEGQESRPTSKDVGAEGEE